MLGIHGPAPFQGFRASRYPRLECPKAPMKARSDRGTISEDLSLYLQQSEQCSALCVQRLTKNLPDRVLGWVPSSANHRPGIAHVHCSHHTWPNGPGSSPSPFNCQAKHFSMQDVPNQDSVLCHAKESLGTKSWCRRHIDAKFEISLQASH